MKQIVPHKVWLGHHGDARDVRGILDQGIEAVVHLAAEERPLELTRSLWYCRFPLVDGAGNPANLLRLAVDTTARLLAMQVPTLVCCGAGLSRTPAIVAAALAGNSGQSPEECLQAIVGQHPCHVSPGLWQEIGAVLHRA